MTMKRTYLLTAAGALVAAVPVIASALVNGLTSSETASWIQAVGTIAAVLIAVWAAQAPLRHLAKDRSERRADYLQAVVLSVMPAYLYLQPTMAKIRAGDWSGFSALARELDPGNTKALRRLLEEPVSNWPSAMLYVEAQKLLSVIDRYIDQVPKHAALAHQGKTSADLLRYFCTKVEEQNERFEACLASTDA